MIVSVLIIKFSLRQPEILNTFNCLVFGQDFIVFQTCIPGGSCCGICMTVPHQFCMTVVLIGCVSIKSQVLCRSQPPCALVQCLTQERKGEKERDGKGESVCEREKTFTQEKLNIFLARRRECKVLLTNQSSPSSWAHFCYAPQSRISLLAMPLIIGHEWPYFPKLFVEPLPLGTQEAGGKGSF